MKHLIFTLVLVLTSTLAISQRKMTDQYQFLNRVYFDSLPRLDTALLDVSTGLYMYLDTVGSSQTGYYVLSNAAAGGSVSGTGASGRVAFWSGASSLSSNSNFKWDNTAGEMSIVAGSGTIPFSVTGGNGDTVQLLQMTLRQTPNDVQMESPSGKGMILVADGTQVLELNATSNSIEIGDATSSAISIEYASGSSISVNGTTGNVGIKTTPSPTYTVSVDAGTGVWAELIDAQESTGVQTATLLNSPVAGNPTGYIHMRINGLNAVVPYWVIP